MASNPYQLHHLRTAAKPFRVHFFSRLRSTNDHAARMRKESRLFAPAIVLTGHQTAGRGRNSNTWWSADGSITVTFVLPIDEHVLPHQLPLVAGLAVRNALAEVTGESGLQLKWPNDLVWRGRKLAGLLCERVHKADLVGLGVNVLQSGRVPKSIADRVGWLSQVSKKPLIKTDVLLAVAGHLHAMLTRRDEHPFSTILREYDRHHSLLNRKIAVTTSASETPITGTCKGLDSMGRLLVARGGQLHRIIAGQVM
jgi:BirA family biotin operon repressor/biotin-[acetyl-CoA-carboxylase] ligase